jgi:mono/diheme cytochrome c family protein
VTRSRSRFRAANLLRGAVLAVLVAGLGWAWVTRPLLPAAERGRRLAGETGCFACHGPGGTRGAANPGRSGRTVPTFEGDLMMYASSAQEIREWIRDGVTAAKSGSRTWQTERDRGALVMPAFGDRLSEREIDDLVAFVQAQNGSEVPGDSLALAGMHRAKELGCFGCHGPGGRLARPNPGSFKGYVPSWDGADFPDLVQDRPEFDEWVEMGVSAGFANNPVASFFLDRAALSMPAYRDHLVPGDTDALWAYVQWLRESLP